MMGGLTIIPTTDARVGITKADVFYRWYNGIGTGIFYYYITSIIPVLGVVLAQHCVVVRDEEFAQKRDFVTACLAWDGRQYRDIAADGYSYSPVRPSNVAFFPVYPLVGRMVSNVAGIRVDVALLVTAHAFLALSFVIMAVYGQRSQCGDARYCVQYVLLCMGLFPTTFFFRMAYSEAAFLCVAILSLYGMRQYWPLPVTAALVGLASGTRPVGIVLVLPFVLHIWDRSPTIRRGALSAIVLVPLACWGIVAYMLYQWRTFDEPWAFALTQEHFRMRPSSPLATKLGSLLTLDPIRAVFDPSDEGYWQSQAPYATPIFNLHFANPLYFGCAIILTVLGGCKGWLNRYEVALAGGLLALPYATRAYEMNMASMGRFTSVAFPVYIVLGNMLARLPSPLSAGLLSVSGFMLGAYTALFAARYQLF
jgi:hypothetical protein